VRARILFLAQLLPYPPVCGGTLRSFYTLKRLCAAHDVTLLTFERKPADKRHAELLRGHCSEVIAVPMKRSRLANARWAAWSLARRSCFMIDRDFTREMQNAVGAVLSERRFDLTYVDHLQMSQYVRGKRPGARVLDEHNVEWRIIQRIAETERRGLRKLFASVEWPKLREYELSVCEQYDAVSTVTEQDRATLLTENPRIGKVDCVPTGVDPHAFRPVASAPGSKTILSVATMSWPPNEDAVLYFCSEIYPLVKRRVPEARLVLAGSRPAGAVKRLEADPSISVPGFVEDIHELASKCAVFIVPLRCGSGIRVKILNAMAMGLPVVSTTVGCEGIDVTDGENILIGDEPEVFASQVARLLEDPAERLRLGYTGREFIMRSHAWDVILPKFDALIESALSRAKAYAGTG